jgi:hypothetical protein
MSETFELSPLPDLTVCPDEILARYVNAAYLWPKFLRKTGVAMSTKGQRVLDNGSRRAQIIRAFGIPSLIQRLSCAKTAMERARVWWRESVASSEGDSIPDLSSENLYVLNPFVVTKELKYADPRTAHLARSAGQKNTVTESIGVTEATDHDSKRDISVHSNEHSVARTGY